MKKCWHKIANIMQEKGYNVTATKCSTKLQALKRTYKSVIDHNKKSGNNPKEWEYLKVKYVFIFMYMCHNNFTYYFNFRNDYFILDYARNIRR